MSTVSWGSAFPTTWPRKRIKYLCRFAGGGTPDKGNPEYWNGGIPWVSPKDMKSATVDDTEDHITRDGLESSAAKLVAPGAVLLVMRSGILRHSIPVAINRVSIALNQDMRALIPFPQVEARFLARLVEGHQQQLLNAWSKVGSTVESLESDLVGETEIAVPALDQQRAIADYLDRETARLDALVAAKERVLGLLAEKRRALITRAVTRGFDPSAPLRDSGIPWLGEIPAHWKVVQLKFACNSLQTGPFGSQLHSEDYVTGGTPVVNPSHLSGGRIHAADGVSVGEATADRLAAHRLRLGDIVFARRGEMGRCGVVEAANVGWLCGTGSLRVRLRKDSAVPYYLALVFSDTRISDVLAVQSVGSTMDNLNSEILGGCHVPMPPLEEQRTIVHDIDRETVRLDAIRAATGHAITLLKERRAALIVAVVTGQIDVEDAA